MRGFSPCIAKDKENPIVTQSASWRNLLRDSSFFLLLLTFDRDLANQVRAKGCPHCGARLHFGRYERKPRGTPLGLPPEYDLRESLCCSADGCRKRVLPPSLRFFGRRVYVAPVFVLACVMIGGITEKRAAMLYELVGVTIRTLARWRAWWRKAFPPSTFWRAARARFALPVKESLLPASLLERFCQPAASDHLLAVLRFLRPLTAGSNCPMDL
ncbi:MAG: hypothetical protein CMG93_17740 [Marinomonas sp.]|jgi:hypothetical protein|nr:hypothetical protein [Marinomonas sp.]|tara:strand:- start:489 stop:1130 length:642 start_codon:yes stop_codon:yes gene_type:complete